jgi:hypothetical protein
VNQLLRETLATLRNAGFEPRVERRRHVKVSFVDAQQRKCVVILSCSPSNRHAAKRNRSLLRRILRGQETCGGPEREATSR